MTASDILSRLRLAFALLLGALALSGCVTGEGDDRHLQPLPAKLVSEMAARGMSQGDPILVRIFKKESELEVWKRDRSGRYALLKTYPMCRWSGQLGPKKAEGDRQAPEGFYTVTADLMNPRSQFYLSFNLGYPNAYDRARQRTGSALMVHGNCVSIGCYAMTDTGIEEIWTLMTAAYEAGQLAIPVHAFPFAMTEENLAAYKDNQWSDFWSELEPAWRKFQVNKTPPSIRISNGRYVIRD